jgi:putative holliday junction resolvase
VGRILAIDYGKVRIGSALSDERRILATPLQVFTLQKKKENTFLEIKNKLSSFSPVDLLVIGLPLLLNGQEGDMAKEAKVFGNALSSYLGIPCVFWDERLSSAQVDKLMKEENLSRKQRAGLCDTLAATLILQNYLDFCLSKSPYLR